MKIMACFIDMASGEYMNVCNKNAKENALDKMIVDLGGIVFSKCYTPAPDTARSSACMWTGVYPKKNHCINRLKWSMNDINQDIDNLWKLLGRSGYDVNIYLNKDDRNIGLIPLCGNEHVYSESVYDFFENANITDNSFNFFYLPDIHYVFDEIGIGEQSFEEGVDLQVNIIEEILDFYNAKETFDYIFFFSDHGFFKDYESREKPICDARIHTLMFLHKKNDEEIIYDTSLRSVMDIFPTVSSIINSDIHGEVVGSSLLDKSNYDYIMVEDLGTFGLDYSQIAEHWCVVMPNGNKHWLECDGVWEHECNDSFDEDKFFCLIRREMSDFERINKLSHTHELYSTYAKYHTGNGRYSNGEPFRGRQYIFDKVCEIKGKKILLYGAGKVGKDYYKQFSEENVCDIVGWIDLNYEKLNEQSYPIKVSSLGSINTLEYDFIVLCFADKKVVSDVKLILSQIGVPIEKIVWEAPSIHRKVD